MLIFNPLRKTLLKPWINVESTLTKKKRDRDKRTQTELRRLVSDILEVRTLKASDSPVKECYVSVYEALAEKMDYDPTCFDDFAPCNRSLSTTLLDGELETSCLKHAILLSIWQSSWSTVLHMECSRSGCSQRIKGVKASVLRTVLISSWCMHLRVFST